MAGDEAPPAGGKNAEIRATKIKQRREDQRAWEAEHGFKVDPEAFTRDIMPQLTEISLTLLANATGLSVQYCSLIRGGLKVPHQRHWNNWAKLKDF